MKKATFHLRNRTVVFPDDAACEVCGFFDISRADVQALMAESGRSDLDAARCRCAETTAFAERQDKERARTANLPHEYSGRHRTLTGFQMRAGTHEAYTAIERMCRGEDPPILCLVGPTGSGKTHLLESLGRTYLARGYRVRYELAANYVDAFRGDHQPGLGEWYSRFNLTILDDLGMERITPFGMEKITWLVEDRLSNGGKLVIATNLVKAGMEDRYGHRLASRLWDRSDSGQVKNITLLATDYRAAVGG